MVGANDSPPDPKARDAHIKNMFFNLDQNNDDVNIMNLEDQDQDKTEQKQEKDDKMKLSEEPIPSN